MKNSIRVKTFYFRETEIQKRQTPKNEPKITIDFTQIQLNFNQIDY